MAHFFGTFKTASTTTTVATEPSSPGSLEQLALNAVQNPGETARQFLPPWHSVRKEKGENEFTDNRQKWQKEHAKKFRYVMQEFKGELK